jgi:hypothetical protein
MKEYRMPNTGSTRAPDIGLYLRRLRYPATRDEALRVGRAEQAPGNILRVLRELPDRVYCDPLDLVLALRRD